LVLFDSIPFDIIPFDIIPFDRKKKLLYDENQTTLILFSPSEEATRPLRTAIPLMRATIPIHPLSRQGAVSKLHYANDLLAACDVGVFEPGGLLPLVTRQ
jgi:hypothetical protein